MEDLYERFLREKRYLANVSPRTIDAYRWAHVAFAPAFESSPLIDRAAMVEQIARLLERGLSPISVNAHLRALNVYARWLQEQGHAERIVRMPLLKEPQRIAPTFSDPQTRRLIAYQPKTDAERHVYAVACLILDTGLRIDEALSIDRETDIDLEQLLLTVRDGKGGKGRIVPMSLAGRRVLYRHLQRLAPAYGSLAFFAGDGTKIGQRNALRTFKRICAACGVKGVRTSFHTLRHTFATAYLRNGGDVFRLQRILGHAKLDMTRRYVQLQTEDLRSVHHRLSALAATRR